MTDTVKNKMHHTAPIAFTIESESERVPVELRIEQKLQNDTPVLDIRLENKTRFDKPRTTKELDRNDTTFTRYAERLHDKIKQFEAKLNIEVGELDAERQTDDRLHIQIHPDPVKESETPDTTLRHAKDFIQNAALKDVAVVDR